jgi:hypothetical protein
MGVTLIQIFIHFPGDVERENWLRPTPFLIFITLLEKYSQKKKEKRKNQTPRHINTFFFFFCFKIDLFLSD